jgi:hypothetical protein
MGDLKWSVEVNANEGALSLPLTTFAVLPITLRQATFCILFGHASSTMSKIEISMKKIEKAFYRCRYEGYLSQSAKAEQSRP